MDELTPAEVKSVAEQIDAWNSRYPKEELHLWHIHAIAQLDMQIEAYEVIYENGWCEIWFRNEQGQLEPAEKMTYLAPEYRLKGQK